MAQLSQTAAHSASPESTPELTAVPLMQLLSGVYAAKRWRPPSNSTSSPRFQPAAALMSLTMLIETEGRNYTWSEYTKWLEQAGFRDIERIPIQSPGANGLLVGRKP